MAVIGIPIGQAIIPIIITTILHTIQDIIQDTSTMVHVSLPTETEITDVHASQTEALA